MRLADTELVIEVERDFTVYGEEVKFGGGKVIRDGMGQSQATRADGAVDTVITNALIVDHWGIVKADIGIKDGRIARIGKAGNPDIQPGVDIVIGPGTEIIAGEGKIVTAGGIDAHIHFICPQQIEEALIVRRHHDDRRRHRPGRPAPPRPPARPGPGTSTRMLAGGRGLPDEPRLPRQGQRLACPRRCASRSRPAPAASSCTRTGARRRRRSTLPRASPTSYDVQVAIHTDTLNESGFVEDTIAAFKGRTIHTYHTEGAGGGHAPDIIKVGGPAERAAVVDQPDAALHRQHASTSISTC